MADSPALPEVASTAEAEADVPRCRDVKHGRVTLMCELDRDHKGWHKATYADHQEVTYQGAHHVVDLTEVVIWEPVDHAQEAVRHIMKGAGRE